MPNNILYRTSEPYKFNVEKSFDPVLWNMTQRLLQLDAQRKEAEKIKAEQEAEARRIKAEKDFDNMFTQAGSLLYGQENPFTKFRENYSTPNYNLESALSTFPANLNTTKPTSAVKKEVTQQVSTETKPKYAGLFSGNLRSLGSRQLWVKNNADYLKSQGWTDDEISGYQGLNLTNNLRASLNMRLAKQLGGADEWYKSQRESAEARNHEMPMAELKPAISPLGFDNATIRGENEPDRRAMLRTPHVNIKTKVGSTYIPATYTEEGAGKTYSFTPLAKNGGKLAQKYYRR